MGEYPQNLPEQEVFNTPKVTIEIVPQENHAKGTFTIEKFVIKDENGEMIGNGVLNISRSKKSEPSAYLNNITVIEEKRGKGFGKAAYIELIKNLGDIKLKSGFQLSRGSVKVWEWLSVNGFARKINEGEINEDTDNKGYSSAEYESLKLS